MIRCRPHNLPREFLSVFSVAVCIPTQTEAGTTTALNELYFAISKQENAHPEATSHVAGDFRAGKLFQFYLISVSRDAYKALPRPPFDKSDHNNILMIPAYKQKLKQEALVTQSIKKWSDEADAKLHDCFASTD
jgi:hypothetical protein